MNISEDLTREVERLISRFGAATVRDETNRLCKGKAGNKTKPDFPHLMEDFEKDARDWLVGRDPFKERTDYSIGKAFADRFIGSSKVSTRKRIEKKLRKERHRAMLVGAFWIAERELPFEKFFEVAAEAARLAPSVNELASLRRDELEKYRGLFGEPPNDMTILEISEGLKSVPVSQNVNFLQTLIGVWRK